MRLPPLRSISTSGLGIAAALALLPTANSSAASPRAQATQIQASASAAAVLSVVNTNAGGGGIEGQVGPSLYAAAPGAGVYGIYNASGTVGEGLLGFASNGTGVVAETFGGVFSAIYAQNYSAAAGPGAEALSSGDGLVGISTGTNGIVGITNEAASGTTAAGVYGEDNTNDNSGQGSNVGVLGSTNNGLFGVEGKSGNGAAGGVYGLATTGYGVEGASSSGTAIYGNTSSGFGVEGISSSNVGVYGQSGTSFGVEGVNTSTTASEPYQNEGVEGTSDVGPGVLASSSQGDGLYAFSGSNSGAFIESEGAGEPTLQVEWGSTSNTGEAIDVFNYNTGDILVLTATGDLKVAGSITGNLGAGTFSRPRNPSTDETLYVPQEAEAITEDVGSAQLVNGSAAVPLGADFKQTIDGSSAYMVFLTPYGDTSGLYVASRSSAGFVVREAHGGRSTLAFDYRIVARPYGARLARLAQRRLNEGLLHRHAGSRFAPAQLPAGELAARTVRPQRFAVNRIPAGPPPAAHALSQQFRLQLNQTQR